VKKIMDKLKAVSWFVFIISVASILYALIINPAYWIVYAISIVFIPLSILSLGLLSMARGKKEEEEDKRKEPFIGY
jgi:energy-converting hydrogenase A subunit I